MIRFFTKENGILTELEKQVTGCWICITPPFNKEELSKFATEIDIYEDYLTDPLDLEERPRYEKDEDTRFIIVSSPILNNVDKENESIYITIPIGIVLTPDYIITISPFDNPIIDLFLMNKVRNFSTKDHSFFILKLMEQNVLRFLSCLKKLNHKRNHIEKELYSSSRNMEIKQLLSIEKSLVFFVNALHANELLKIKMKRTNFLQINDDEDKLDLFEDIIIDNSQAMDMSKVYTDILGGTMDAYASIISNNLNIVMKRLTTITIVLMIPTLVASFFGMNVTIPFERSPYAFTIIMIFSLLLSLTVAWVARKKQLF